MADLIDRQAHENDLWNLRDGFENVCNSVRRKLHYANHVLEEQNHAIINLDSYEVTAMIWAMKEYIHSFGFAEWDGTGGTNGMHLCEEAVRNQPSTEPMVVQCKDCIFRRDDHCDYVDYWLQDDDFCSRGENGITWRT